MTLRRRMIRVAIICSILAVFVAEVSSNDCRINEVCLPGPRNLAKLKYKSVIASSTCGDPPTQYCKVKPLNTCKYCNGTDHAVEKMTDDSFSTSWQSVTWWDWYLENNRTNEPLKVNVTISFNKSYALTGEIRLLFKSPRPREMILEKSDDKGKTWSTLQYYAQNCLGQFNITSSSIENNLQGDFSIHCVEEYSNFLPQEDGEVKFDFLRRYSKSHFWNGTLQEYLTATDIRVQMLYPGTEGQNNLEIKTEEIYNQYFYSVADLKVIGRCQCHGHAKYCDYPEQKGKDCDCGHNTEGEDCERCKPLFNNRTWMPATSEEEPNPCQACECHSHANSCHYNSTLGHGVCDNCDDNTTGLYCEQCLDKFYRNMSKPLNDSAVCLPCNCFMFGIINNGSCNQTTGQCACKQNVTGRQCDKCEDTFWGFHLPPEGDCRECGCNANGTRNGTLSCDQYWGDCPCKDNIHLRTCSECRDGFFSFPTTVAADCLQCDCDYGGSRNKICEKENGTCLCRNKIEGKRCTRATPGFFVASFDHFKHEAEDAMGDYTSTAYFTGVNQQFTGRGYAKVEQNQFIAFSFDNNRSSSVSFSGYIVVRYKKLKEDNVTLRLVVHSCNSSFCHVTEDLSFSLLSSGFGLAWISSEPISFHRGQVYHLNLTFIGGWYVNSSVEIDSLILLPDIRDTRINNVTAQQRGAVHGMTSVDIEDCWKNSTSLSGLLNSQSVCMNVTFSVMSEVFDGALPCSCNKTGTENGTTCMPLGGQCHCKPGVTGRSCDRCLPGYFNFTNEGCTACNCSELGSSDLVCDPVTGQCPCRPGVVTRTCGRCNASYYGFHTGRGCQECRCNESGSADLQCNSNGDCQCKNSTSGKKCDECRRNFFNFTSAGCQPCNCHEGGSSSLQCHQSSGICPCKTNAEGNKCEKCKNGTYNSDPNNPDGCSPCFCYGRSSSCSSAQGFVRSHLTANFSANGNLDGTPNRTSFQMLDDTGLRVNFTAGTYVKLTLRSSFAGNQIHSYNQLFKLTMDYSGVNASVLATWNLTLRGTNIHEASFNVSPPPSTSNKEYDVRLHEHHAVDNLTAYELQSILADIEFVQLHGSFMSSGAVTIGIRLVTATKGVGEEVAFVENCTCPNNYTELSCGYCNSGYTRQDPRISHPRTPCVLCSCSGRSTDCYPENGTCYNCRTGSEGRHCETCQRGVLNSTDCTRCIPGFFGLTPFSGGCQECDCVLPNTMYGNSSVCNETSGKCSCKAKIGGRQCDRCHENAYNTSRGCVDCPECYRLIYEEVEQLRVKAGELESTVRRLQNGDIGDASFAQRLSNATKHVDGIVAEAEEAREKEKNLTMKIKGLNETLNNLEGVLVHELTPKMNNLSGNLESVLADKNITDHLISQIRDALNYGHRVLNMSIDVSVQEAESRSKYLNSLVPRFSELASNLTIGANRQNTSAFEIEDIVNKTKEKIDHAKFVIGNASLEQEKLEGDLKRLRERVKNIQAFGEKINSTNYALYMNASVILARANQTSAEVEKLEPDSWDTVSQIKVAAENAIIWTRKIVSEIQNITERYNNLTYHVKLAVEEAKTLTSHVSKAQWRGQTILDEANRARTEGLDALRLAEKTFADAENMLQILQNFEAKSSEAQKFAEESLQRALKSNSTSRNVIKYAQEINTTLQDTLVTATRNVDLARQAWNISQNEKNEVAIIHENAITLNLNASQSKYTKEYFAQVKLNASSVNSTSQQHIVACEQNYSSESWTALQKAYLAKDEADKADTAVKNLTVKVEHLVQEVDTLQKVNTSRLGELKKDIERIREGFTQENITEIIKQLKEAKDDQEKFLNEYRAKVRERRNEIVELKQLHLSLASIPCETPLSGTVLET